MIQFWLAASIATLIFAIYTVVMNGAENNLMNFVFPLLTFTMYLSRRYTFKRWLKMQEDLNNNSER